MTSEQTSVIERHTYLANAIASNLMLKLSPRAEFDELLSVGLYGLAQAALSFEENRRISFATYACHRIRGAMLDHLRSMDFLSREQRSALTRVQRARDAHYIRNGALPTVQDLQHSTGLSPQTIERARCTEAISIVNLASDVEGHFGERCIADIVSDPNAKTPERLVIDRQVRQVLDASMVELSPKERAILSGVLDGRKFIEILHDHPEWRISVSRVSQLYSSAVAKMKSELVRRGITRTQDLWMTASR